MLDSESKLNLEKEKLKKFKEENYIKECEKANLEIKLKENMFIDTFLSFWVFTNPFQSNNLENIQKELSSLSKYEKYLKEVLKLSKSTEDAKKVNEQTDE